VSKNVIWYVSDQTFWRKFEPLHLENFLLLLYNKASLAENCVNVRIFLKNCHVQRIFKEEIIKLKKRVTLGEICCCFDVTNSEWRISGQKCQLKAQWWSFINLRYDNMTTIRKIMCNLYLKEIKYWKLWPDYIEKQSKVQS